MNPLHEILVDTSVWIKFFRQSEAREAIHLDGLLQARCVAFCMPIRAEIISGCRNEHERLNLRDLFSAVTLLELPSDVWERIEELRFKLARKGRSASLIDLMIAYTSAHHQAPLWTLDGDFDFISEVLRYPRYLPVAMKKK